MLEIKKLYEFIKKKWLRSIGCLNRNEGAAIVIVTIFLVVCNITFIVFSFSQKKQAKINEGILQDQADIMKDEFRASNRPYLEIYPSEPHVQFLGIDYQETDKLSSLKYIQFNFMISNSGKIPAEIKNVLIEIPELGKKINIDFVNTVFNGHDISIDARFNFSKDEFSEFFQNEEYVLNIESKIKYSSHNWSEQYENYSRNECKFSIAGTTYYECLNLEQYTN